MEIIDVIYQYLEPTLVLVIAFVAVIYSVIITIAYTGLKIKYKTLVNRLRKFSTKK